MKMEEEGKEQRSIRIAANSNESEKIPLSTQCLQNTYTVNII